MKRVLEPLIVFLICYSVIELLTIVISSLLFSYFGYTNVEAFTNARSIMLEVSFCALFTFIIMKILQVRRQEVKIVKPDLDEIKNEVFEQVMSDFKSTFDKSKKSFDKDASIMLKKAKKNLLADIMNEVKNYLKKSEVKMVHPKVQRLVIEEPPKKVEKKKEIDNKKLEEIKKMQEEIKKVEESPKKPKKKLNIPFKIIFVWLSILTLIGPVLFMLLSKDDKTKTHATRAFYTTIGILIIGIAIIMLVPI